jgi:hypothetical protein
LLKRIQQLFSLLAVNIDSNIGDDSHGTSSILRSVYRRRAFFIDFSCSWCSRS